MSKGEEFRRYCLQKERPGEWSVWSLSPHTGSKQECLDQGSWQYCRAVGDHYVKGGILVHHK